MGGLTLFPETELAKERVEGKFTPLSEKEMLEDLDVDTTLINHHTQLGINFTGVDFLPIKEKILKALDNVIQNMDEEYLTYQRSIRNHL